MRTRTARRSRPTNLSNRGVGTLPWSYLFVIAVCGCVIAAGFLFAARQHFMSMDLGMKNSKLRKQLEDLESENRRLMLAREVAISPIEITRAAKNFGFIDLGESTLAIPVSASPMKKTDGPVVIKAVATDDKDTKAVLAGVTRTSYQRPSVVAVKPESPKKPAAEKSSDKNAKKTEKSKTAKPNATAIAKR